MNYREEVKEPSDCWLVFRKVGRVVGIFSVAASIACLGLFISVPGIVFTILGKKATGKIRVLDLILNILGLIISIIFLIEYVIAILP